MTKDKSDRTPVEIAQAVAAELGRQLDQPLPPGLYLVATPIGNLGDVTLRAVATLARADLIACEDTRHSRILLDHFAIGRPMRAYHEHNAEAERPRILAALAEGKTVALISDAGTPLISDPGYKLVRQAAEAGVRITALPGPSAVLAGLSLAGLPTDCFLFAGFLPPRESARRARLEELGNVPATLIFFEAPSRLAAALKTLADVYAERQVAVARELTKRFEEVRRGTAPEMAAWAAAATEIKGEVLIVAGPPERRAISDAEIASHLEQALPEMSLRDAARDIAADLGVAKSRVYDIGLKIKAGSR
jgi:16S rRNA (cytidine1402-2'-O)-methyltransferase